MFSLFFIKVHGIKCIKTFHTLLQKAADDDLTVCDKPLPCPGQIVPVPGGQSLLFTDCLILTQFFSSLKKFIEADHKITASSFLCPFYLLRILIVMHYFVSEQLLDAVHGGRVGFMKCTSKLLGSLLKTLLQDPEHKVRFLIPSVVVNGRTILIITS